MSSRVRLVEALVKRVMGPDLFEAEVDLDFDVKITKRLKLAGVDSMHLRTLPPNDSQKAAEFLRDRIEGRAVLLRTLRRGEHFYARVYYGPEESDVLEEMVGLGLLRRFDKEAFNGNGDRH